MFRESIQKIKTKIAGMLVQLPVQKTGFRGIISAKYEHRDAHGAIIDYGDVGGNIVVDYGGSVLARLCKDPTEPTTGFWGAAVGSGDPAWDPLNPPVEDPTSTLLEVELDRKAFASSWFIDPATGLPTIVPTVIVDFQVTFGPGEGVGNLVELGVFGGDATAVAGSGTLVSLIHFPIKVKAAPETFSWILRYSF